MTVEELLQEATARYPKCSFIELNKNGGLFIFEETEYEWGPILLKHYSHYSDILTGMSGNHDAEEYL